MLAKIIKIFDTAKVFVFDKKLTLCNRFSDKTID